MAEQKIEGVERLKNIVTSDDVVIKPKHRIRDVFISNDVDGIGDYILWSVVVPAVRGMLSDACHGTIDRFFGKGSGRSDYSSRYGYKRRDYSSRYDRSYRDREREDRGYSSKDSEVLFRSRAKAEEVRDTLYEIIDRRGHVSIAHLNDLLDIPYSDRDKDDDIWGWYDIGRSRIKGTRDGYVLDLPRPERID